MRLINEIKLRVRDFQNGLNRSNSKHRECVDCLITDGYYVIENYLPENELKVLSDLAYATIEKYEERVVIESGGADKRIYGVDLLEKQFSMDNSMNLPNQIASEFYRGKFHWFQMLGAIDFSSGNLGSGSGWHRDSPFSHQFKFILYLSDVTVETGPFEYIKGSHTTKAIKEYSKYLTVPLDVNRFSNEQIEQLEKSGIVGQKVTVLGEAGTLLMANVRGLHRGKPLTTGSRLATTRYYFGNDKMNYFNLK